MNAEIDSQRRPKAIVMRPIHAISSCIVFVLLAFLVNTFFYTESLLSILKNGEPLLIQLGFGVLIGAGYAAINLLFFIIGGRYISWIGNSWTEMQGLLAKFDLSGLNFIWFAFCAGVGEELLFRGALQPIIGIGWSSVIFAAVHMATGELSKPNWKKLVYVASTFIASFVLAYTFIYFGLLAAIVAHVVVDIICFFVGLRSIKITSGS